MREIRTSGLMSGDGKRGGVAPVLAPILGSTGILRRTSVRRRVNLKGKAPARKLARLVHRGAAFQAAMPAFVPAFFEERRQGCRRGNRGTLARLVRRRPVNRGRR